MKKIENKDFKTLQRSSSPIIERKKDIAQKYNAKGLDTKRFKIEIVPVGSVYELGAELFG